MLSITWQLHCLFFLFAGPLQKALCKLRQIWHLPPGPPFTLIPLWRTEVKRPERCMQSSQVSLQAWEDNVDPKNHWGGRDWEVMIHTLRSDWRLESWSFSRFSDIITSESHESLRWALWCPGNPRAPQPLQDKAEADQAPFCRLLHSVRQFAADRKTLALHRGGPDMPQILGNISENLIIELKIGALMSEEVFNIRCFRKMTTI